ncbi:MULTISPECIES: hypothetical protein [unclassified Pseudomonas]|uniref:hypothetical protein n=1 Tax=unclassified Pseudomonas TaxID=196821 RepID=UPI0025FD8A16|nr:MULTISPECIES: hypothetical protein [unclassified Pseudomonas]
MPTDKSRIICQFSCGATSAVATKLALAKYSGTHDVVIVNAFLFNEHQDNRRFLADCEAWFGRPVTVLRDTKYGADVIQVFRRERYVKNQYGAPCTKLLKRRLLDTWKQPNDVMVFGYTAEEVNRFDGFRERNPDRQVIAPLMERGLGKEDCKAMIDRAGIQLPLMYRLGYDNANCTGLRAEKARLSPAGHPPRHPFAGNRQPAQRRRPGYAQITQGSARGLLRLLPDRLINPSNPYACPYMAAPSTGTTEIRKEYRRDHRPFWCQGNISGSI